MAQSPQWYRKKLYEHKLGLDSPNADLLDIKDYSARKKAVEDKLREDDRKYTHSIKSLASKYKKELQNEI